MKKIIAISLLCSSVLLANNSIIDINNTLYANSYKEFNKLNKNNYNYSLDEITDDFIYKAERMMDLSKIEKNHDVSFKNKICFEDNCLYKDVTIINDKNNLEIKKTIETIKMDITEDRKNVKNIYFKNFEDNLLLVEEKNFENIDQYYKFYNSYFNRTEIPSVQFKHTLKGITYKSTPLFFNIFNQIDKDSKLSEMFYKDILSNLKKENTSSSIEFVYDKDKEKGMVKLEFVYSDLIKYNIDIHLSKMYFTNKENSVFFGNLAVLTNQIDIKIDKTGLNKHVKEFKNIELQQSFNEWKKTYLDSEFLSKKKIALNKYKEVTGENKSDIWLNEILPFETFDNDIIDLSIKTKQDTTIDSVFNLSIFLQTGYFYNFKNLENLDIVNNKTETTPIKESGVQTPIKEIKDNKVEETGKVNIVPTSVKTPVKEKDKIIVKPSNKTVIKDF